MREACGIDFGTSNSAVALGRDGSARLVALQAGATSVPTALFFSFEDDSVTFGLEAISRYLGQEEGRLLRSIKSLLGTSLYEETTQVRSRRYGFGEIVAEFLRFLRRGTAAELGHPPETAVLGRPVFFVDDDEAADRKAEAQLAAAAHAAGFREIEFQFEPIAAALHYESTVVGEELALVADIGGGTSDFSVVRVSPTRARKADRRADILACNGVHIGGTDFDRALSMATLMPYLGLRSRLRMKGMEAPSWYFADLATWHRVNALYEPRVLSEIRGVRRDSEEPAKIDRLIRVVEERLGHSLLGRIEQAKIELSAHSSHPLALADIAEGLGLDVERRQLERAIAEGIERIGLLVREVIALAGLGPEAVAVVFLTGGSSGIPAVRRAIAKAVPGARLVTGDAFGSVAAGLALDAARRLGST